MKIHIRFESHNGTYVSVLSGSPIVSGMIASQNAGSTNRGIYYQVGGGGVNGLFHSALGPAETAAANVALKADYDTKFGSWTNDSQLGAKGPLTSFYVPIAPDKCVNASAQTTAMLYSVGPQGAITDEAQYQAIYTEAFALAANANRLASQSGAPTRAVEAVRVTMVSTGIYGGASNANTAARLILDGLVQAASTEAAVDMPTTILVNCAGTAGSSKEIDAFTHAASLRGLSVDAAGFAIDATTAS